MDIQFWQDPAKRLIDPMLFSEKAEELAKLIASDRRMESGANKPTQIRKFYDEVIRFKGICVSDPENFPAVLPYIKMLNAKIAYAQGRKLITSNFGLFINKSLKQVNNKDDFEIFCSFFEAFIGFYKLHGGKD